MQTSNQKSTLWVKIALAVLFCGLMGQMLAFLAAMLNLSAYVFQTYGVEFGVPIVLVVFVILFAINKKIIAESKKGVDTKGEEGNIFWISTWQHGLLFFIFAILDLFVLKNQHDSIILTAYILGTCWSVFCLVLSSATIKQFLSTKKGEKVNEPVAK